MPESVIESVLTGKLDSSSLLKWLRNENPDDTPEDCLLYCNRNEFVAYFLSYLRSQSNSILQTNNNILPPLHQTPEKVHNPQRKHRRSISEPTSDNSKDSLTVSQSNRSQESPSHDRKKTGRRVKTKLFPEDKNLSVSSDESRLSIGIERIAVSSTPLKNSLRLSDYSNLTSPVTPARSFKEHERCDTPRLNHRHRSHEKSCLGDYIISVSKTNKKKKNGRNASDDSETKLELDLSNSDVFPEIGARKSSSLRSEKRRIKPTNIDKSTSRKSLSLSSFNSDCFQQPSPLALKENDAFKLQTVQTKESTNSFDAERSMLKLERHKLMEKFNILNTSASTKTVTPQIKITQKESLDNTQPIVKANVANILYKEKLDLLIIIYEVLISTNLILSVNSEIYFLILVILSNQYESEFQDIELKLRSENVNYLLKSIHNCTYFATKSLWNLRVILEVILDKTSLKTLGENKKVRCFCPELAKFLLNAYGLKCELENSQDKKITLMTRGSNGVICFNHETDNVDNFPSVLTFQNFKKQRDMFYEIVRWYQESQATRCSRSSFRTMIKSLLSYGISPANYAHLAALFMQHMVAECLPANLQESKLSKLQRRLTSPNIPESHRLPRFSQKEMFYKEFLMCTENEPFRVHLRDALCSEIVILDGTPLSSEDRASSNTTDVTKEFHSIAKKLALLSKFLGFLASLPYTYIAEQSSKTVVMHKEASDSYAQPKEKVLENNITLRNHIQPAIDIKGMLLNAYENSRILITLPWIVHYLSMLDYSTLRTKYFQELLKIIRHIYSKELKITETAPKKNTMIFLKSVLGWLFDLPHFPQDINCDNISIASVKKFIDYEMIDEVVLFDLCPYLRDLNVLLSTCKVSSELKDIGSFRHITPVSLSLNTEDRMRSKEKELQTRLEEEMLKSQPSSSRRVLEMVTERVTAATVRDLAKPLAYTRDRAMAQAVKMVKERGNMSQPVLLQSLVNLFAEHLRQLRITALESAKSTIKRRTNAALLALLPTAPIPLQALAVNNCINRLNKWIEDHWNTTAVLCKDIEADMKSFLALGEAACLSPKPSANVEAITAPQQQFELDNVSPTLCLINLKEQICVLLDDEDPSDLSNILKNCAKCCSPKNLFNRPPTLKAILQMSVDFCVVFVSRKPQHLFNEFLNLLHDIWNTCCPDRKRNVPEDLGPPERRSELSPDFRNFDDDERAPSPISDDENPQKITDIIIQPTISTPNDNKVITINVTNDKNVTIDNKSVTSDKSLMKSEKTEEFSNLEYFDRILCPRNIALLSSSKCKQSDVWEALATVLVFMLKNDYLSEDSLTEQCLAVYRQDWPQNILENLSSCMKSVSARWSRSSTGKFTLFLDFLAEYCGDMDYEPLE